MSDLILHHYPASPFSEKIRLILGFKGLSWRSVVIPRIMPKPDLTALTGGYRKTPVLQIGADIYCDTALIARRLEQFKASPPLFPDEHAFSAQNVAAWADAELFQHAVAQVFQPESLAVRMAGVPPEAVKAFVADRKKMFADGSAAPLSIAQVRHQWPVFMARLERLLGQGEDYIFAQPTIADFALAHPLWFLLQTPVTAPAVNAYPQVAAWLKRILSFGHGSPSEMSSADAIAVARDSEPQPVPGDAVEDSNGFQVGQHVSVAALDYGTDPVVGELVHIGAEAVILRREDARVGTVHVHFPRLAFQITALKAFTAD